MKHVFMQYIEEELHSVRWNKIKALNTDKYNSFKILIYLKELLKSSLSLFLQT